MSVSNSRSLDRLAAAFALVALAGSAATVAAPAASAEGALKPRTRPVKSLAASLEHDANPRSLVVKLPDGALLEASGGHLRAAGALGDSNAVAALVAGALAEAPGATVEPLIRVPKPVLDQLRSTGEARSGEELADLSQFYRVRVPAGKGRAALEGLLALAAVENAYPEPRFRPTADIPPTTFNLSPLETYRAVAPTGIDIAAAWAKGLRGQGVTVADLEFFWNLHHEDLEHLASQVPPVAIVPESDWLPVSLLADTHHGTASLGVLAAGDNGYGMTGLVPDATFRVVPTFRFSDPSWGPANAVIQTILTLAPGDVLLIELETFDGFPFEIGDAEYAVVRQATALGIHVVEPAGNRPGGTLLDDFPAFDWRLRDSGAILVAAGRSVATGTFHDRYPNSNFGTRADTYAWGQNIATLGYGPDPGTILPLLANCATASDAFPLTPRDENQLYTRCYNGTSGAGAIVAGAVAALEQQFVAKWGRPASPREMRSLLRLGTPGVPGIGRQADLAYHLDLLSRGGTIAHSYPAEPSVPAFSEAPAFGATVAGPGDVDGDGLADLAVGAPAYRVPGPTPIAEAGRVYLFSSKSGKLLWTSTGAAVGDRLGHALAAFGDIDGDGANDVAAGAPFANGGKGLVRILSGRTGQLLSTLSGTQANERFGWALASTRSSGGWRHLIVGAPGASDGGRVDLYSGFDGSFMQEVVAPVAGAEFGAAVGGADVDGDGEGDVLVGAPAERDGTGVIAGAVHAFDGPRGEWLFTVRGEVPVGSPNQFGAAVAGVGDLNGDGLEDFAVGAPNWTKNGVQPGFGQVSLYKSKVALPPILIRTFVGPTKDSRLGTAVAAAGDWNGDGHADFAAGEPGIRGGFSSGPPPPGRVRIFLGPFPGVVLQRALTLGGIEKVYATKDVDTQLGAALASAGDTNGDGRNDLAVGEPKLDGAGRALVLASAPAPALGSVRLAAELGAIEAKDSDGDGFAGGGSSPSRSILRIAAGPAWAGASYRISGFVRPPFDANSGANALVAPGSAALHAFSGTLDANGATSTPIFGPIPEASLCPLLIGAEFAFIATVGFDLDGDGVFEQSALSNAAPVLVIHELAGC